MNPKTLFLHTLRAVGGCAAALLIAAGPAARADQQTTAPALGSDLPALLAYAHQHNPALAAQRLEAAAARERLTAAGALPDPQLAIELMDVTNTMNPGRSASLLPGEVGSTTWRLSQMLPFPGKRALRGEVAAAQANSAEAGAQQTRLDVELAIRRAFVEHYRAQRQARILDETIALSDSLHALALQRYTLGLAGQQEVLQLQGERTSLRIESLELVRSQAAARARLNALLPREPDAPLAGPGALPALPAPVALAALVQRATGQAPALRRAQAELGAAERSLALTHRERYPDLGVSLANNRPRAGRASWDVMLEVSIPLQQASRRASEREAGHAHAAAEARHHDAQARLAGALGEAHAALEARRAQLRLMRDALVPQTEAALESARAGYEKGSIGFAPVLAAQQSLLRTRLALLETEVEAALAAADLEQLVGDAL
ncbi:MAG: TolC family protein [Hydrogenophaga sp.]|nr:TolC family protein [Hydrogenophaga sp.]